MSYDTVDPWWEPDFANSVRDPDNFDRRWVFDLTEYTPELRNSLLHPDCPPVFETMPGKPEWVKSGRIGHIYLIIHKKSNKIYCGQTLCGTAKRLQRHISDAEKNSNWAVHQFIRDMPREGLLCIAYKTVCLPALSPNCEQLKVWTKMMSVVETEVIQELAQKMPHRLLNIKQRKPTPPQRKRTVQPVQQEPAPVPAAATAANVSAAAAKAILEQAAAQSDVNVMRALIKSALILL